MSVHAGTRRPDPGPVLRVAAVLALTILTGCAGTPRPSVDAADGSPSVRGYRALFRGRADGPEGKRRFRMAAALLPPDRVRLEFFGPVGSARLIVASDGSTTTVLLPPERVYARQPTTPEIMNRLLGVPFEGSRLIALLTGQPMCSPEALEQQLRSSRPGTFGRRPSWHEIQCPPDEVRYRAVSRERGGDLQRATIREGISGDIILQVAYDDYKGGSGPRWPRKVSLMLARSASKVSLTLIDGPRSAPLAEAIFAPRVPDGFEFRSRLSFLPAPGLLGPTAE